MPFVTLQPLDYYYTQGYNLVNPLCRAILAAPQYIHCLQSAGLPEPVSRSICTKIMSALPGKAKGMLGVESQLLDIVGMEVGNRQQYIKRLLEGINRSENSIAHAPTQDEITAEESYSYSQVKERLCSAWNFVEQIDSAITTKPYEDNLRDIWLTRGDGQPTIAALRAQFPQFDKIMATGQTSSILRMRDTIYETKMFFSTSKEYAVPKPADSYVIWMIRTHPGQSRGRGGGVYTSEAEVLFPLGSMFQLEAVFIINNEKNIKDFDLRNFKVVEDRLRDHIEVVHERNTRIPERILIYATERRQLGIRPRC